MKLILASICIVRQILDISQLKMYRHPQTLKTDPSKITQGETPTKVYLNCKIQDPIRF